MPLHRLLGIRLDDEKAEIVRRNHERAIDEMQRNPLASARVVEGVELPDNIDVYVAHGLGRAPVHVGISAVRGTGLTTGRIVDRTADVSADAKRYVVLQADGWTNAITISVVVF